MSFEKAPLGDYVRVVGGFAFKSEDFADEGIPVVRISDLRDDSVFVAEAAKIPSEKVGRGQNYQVEPGDILIAMSGATTGKIGIVPENCIRPVLQNQRVGNFKIIDPNRIYRRYLKHYLVSSSYQAKIWQSMVGVAQPNISSKQLEQIEIPIPPIAEQKRIAAILDKAEELRGLRRQALEQLDAMTQSIFLEMFGDPATNPKGWQTCTLGELTAKFSDGPFGSNLKTSHYTETGIRVVRLQNIGIGKFNDGDRAYIDPHHFETLRKHECLPGDVLIATLGDPNLRACIQPDWLSVALNKADCVQARPKPGVTNAEYLCSLLNQPSTERMAHDLILGETRLRISMGRLRTLMVPAPPILLQQEFARRVEELEQLKATHRESLTHLDALFASLQHRAFRGEL